MAKCNCGGMHREHLIGEGDCYRVLVSAERHPKPAGAGKWIVDGDIITETTLLEQRMYCCHNTGEWSKVKGHFSSNSLPDET